MVSKAIALQEHDPGPAGPRQRNVGTRFSETIMLLQKSGSAIFIALLAGQSEFPIKAFLSGAGGDRGEHAVAAEPAIAGRILGQILLMIVLGEIELAGGRDLGGDGPQALRRQRFLI